MCCVNCFSITYLFSFGIEINVYYMLLYTILLILYRNMVKFKDDTKNSS